MTILSAKCNRCGKVLESNELTELEDLTGEFKDKKEWLETTHIADLKDLKKKILELRAKLK